MEINFKKLNFLVESKNYQNFWNNFLNWEQNDLNFVTENGEQDKIFIDIGAWIGPYTLIAASMGMKVYAFEPDKVAFQHLKKNIELNKIYSGKVMKIMEFGAFVNFLGKQDGLVHISELADKRVAKVTDVVKEGDEVKVKVIGFDRGKVKLSMKQAND